ncbi:MAG: hypothetical protein HY360_17375 [Verrucomicrobia bacterium]|nr:hypothetical protein [Verrucomicrobiota bacterium]
MKTFHNHSIGKGRKKGEHTRPARSKSATRRFFTLSSPLRWRVDTGTPLNVMRCGIGACWHAIEHPSEPQYTGSAWGGNPPAEDDHAWRRLYELADWTGMSFLRVEVSQRMYEPERRVFAWDSPEMRILYRILDWCQSRGAIVSRIHNPE